MGLPTRAKGFRDRAAKGRQSIHDEYEKSYNTKDDKGFTIGSYFDLDLIRKMDIEIWRPDVGDHIVDVIPFYTGTQHPEFPKGELAYKVEFWGHQRIGPMNDFFVCSARTWKKPDPICTWNKANWVDDDKQFSAVKPYRRCAYFVWVHDNDEQEKKGLQIFEVSHFFFEKKVAEISKKPRGGGYVDWTHEDVGKHVFWGINKSGKYEDASGTKRDSIEYTGFQLIDRENPKIPTEILEQTFALDEVIKMHPSHEEMSTAFFGTSTPPTVEDKPQSRLPKKTALERAREAAMQEAEGPSDEDAPVSGRTPEPEKTEAPPPQEDPPPTDADMPPEREPEEEPVRERGTVVKSDTQTRSEAKPSTEYVCPGAEVGGEFGVTIEQLSECDDCDIWEQCSDENDRILKGGGKKEIPSQKEPAEKKGGKLVRR